MTFTSQAEALLEKLEGLRLNSYQDGGGVWTIGYGHTGKDVKPYSQITEDEAQSLLRDDLSKVIGPLYGMLHVPLNDNEFSALVILAYNIGVDALMHSRLLTYLNAQDKPSARVAWAQWCHIKGVVSPGLVHRRQVEIALFNQPVGPSDSDQGTSNA